MKNKTKLMIAISSVAVFSMPAQAENLFGGVVGPKSIEEVEILAIVPAPEEELEIVEPNPEPQPKPETTKIEFNKPVTLDVKFEFDKDVIIPQYYAVLADMARFIKDNNAHALVEGHTDSKGSHAYNMDLSIRRANSVKQFMVEGFGIDPSRIRTIGQGETKPIATNDTDEGRQQNRRVIAVAMKLDKNGINIKPNQSTPNNINQTPDNINQSPNSNENAPVIQYKYEYTPPRYNNSSNDQFLYGN